MRDSRELQRLKSDAIKNVEIITSPGARYDATVSSVIRIRTVKKQGEGVSESLNSMVWYNGYLGGSEQLSLNYQSEKLNLFGSLWGYTRGHKEATSLIQHIEGTKNVTVNQYDPLSYRNTMGEVNFGFNYDLNDENSIGASYDLECEPYAKGHADGQQEIFNEGQPVDIIKQKVLADDIGGPTHELNAYYVGKVNKLGVDFNGTYLWQKLGGICLKQKRLPYWKIGKSILRVAAIISCLQANWFFLIP